MLTTVGFNSFSLAASPDQAPSITLAEISVSPGDRRKSPVSRPGRAGYSDPNKKINTLFYIQRQLLRRLLLRRLLSLG